MKIPLPDGHAAPVVITAPTLVVTVVTETISREIERLLETKSQAFKKLD